MTLFLMMLSGAVADDDCHAEHDDGVLPLRIRTMNQWRAALCLRPDSSQVVDATKTPEVLGWCGLKGEGSRKIV